MEPLLPAWPAGANTAWPTGLQPFARRYAGGQVRRPVSVALADRAKAASVPPRSPSERETCLLGVPGDTEERALGSVRPPR